MIIPTYNRAKVIGKAIDSIAKQIVPAWEIIVIDDGSSDETRELMASYPQVRYYFQDNAGVSAARNKGAELATGDWLIFLDSDDELLPQALAEFSKAYTSDIKANILQGGYFLNKNGVEKLLIPVGGKYITHLSGSFAIKRSIFLEIGGYDPNIKFAENTELFFRLKSVSKLESTIPVPVLRYNQSSFGGNNDLIESSRSIEYILKKHPDLDIKVRFLYHQILGVNYLRFRVFSKARKNLRTAFFLNPLKFSTLVRLVISHLPFIAKKIYRLNSKVS